jgi:hypothetical protein
MVGMGSVVTKSVPDFALALGAPAVPVGAVCRCGQLLLRYAPGQVPADHGLTCSACGRGYEFAGGVISEEVFTAEGAEGAEKNREQSGFQRP